MQIVIVILFSGGNNNSKFLCLALLFYSTTLTQNREFIHVDQHHYFILVAFQSSHFKPNGCLLCIYFPEVGFFFLALWQ